MPFAMTHLCIAKNIHKFFSGSVKDLPQFYLGAIAPDAVHNRVNYISDYKKASHLCIGDERWGMISNNDEWIESILKFLSKHKNSANYDFVLGYCSHILSDVYNNMTIWMPFMQKYQEELSKGYGGLYHRESEKVDIELVLTVEYKDDFWRYLEKSKGVSLESIIFEDEVEKQKENILYHWYKDKNHQDISSHKIVTIDSTTKFIKDATDFVVGKLSNLS